MVPILWIGWLLPTLTAVVFAAQHPSYLHVDSAFLVSRVTKKMDPKLDELVKSLKLSGRQAESVLQTLQKDDAVVAYLRNAKFDAGRLTSVACKVLRVVLDENEVDTTPVSAAVVEETWSQACWLTPTCIVTPQSKDGVSNAIKFIRFFKLRFAIRSGGHSPNPGFSSINDPGVLIDLQKLNQISVSGDKKIASVGPGARWGQVVEALDPHGVSVIGGRIPQVGVAGVILGGGLFHFSGEYGLAADNVESFEVVLADGSIVDASAAKNSDLFWALKGGGPNFGIVTKFKLNTIPVKDIWFTVTVHLPDQVPALLDAMVAWQQGGASDLKSTVALVIGLDTVTLGLIYSAPTPSANVFAPFDGIAPIAVAVPPTTGTVLMVTQILGSTFSTIPRRHDYRGISSKIDAQLYKDVYNVWKTKAAAVRQTTGANQTFVIQPIPAALAQAGISKGGNPMGIPTENHQWWTTLIDWENAADDAVVRSVSIETTAAWESLSKARGLHIPYVFMNDASRDQNPLASYGQENVSKLKTVALKYDPSRIFQTLQASGFLLSRV